MWHEFTLRCFSWPECPFANMLYWQTQEGTLHLPIYYIGKRKGRTWKTHPTPDVTHVRLPIYYIGKLKDSEQERPISLKNKGGFKPEDLPSPGWHPKCRKK